MGRKDCQGVVLAGMVGRADLRHFENAGFQIVEVLLLPAELVAVVDLDREVATGLVGDVLRDSFHALGEGAPLAPDRHVPGRRHDLAGAERHDGCGKRRQREFGVFHFGVFSLSPVAALFPMASPRASPGSDVAAAR